MSIQNPLKYYYVTIVSLISKVSHQMKNKDWSSIWYQHYQVDHFNIKREKIVAQFALKL